MKRAFAMAAAITFSGAGLAWPALGDEWSSQLQYQNDSQATCDVDGGGDSALCKSGVCPGGQYTDDPNWACCAFGTNALAKGDAGFGALGSKCSSKTDCCHWDCDKVQKNGIDAGSVCVRPDGFSYGHGIVYGCQIVYDPANGNPALSTCDAGADCCSTICQGGGHGHGTCVQPSQGTCKAWYQCTTPQTCSYDAGYDIHNSSYSGTCQSDLNGPCTVDQDCLHDPSHRFGCILDAGGKGTCQVIEYPLYTDNPCPQGVVDCQYVDGGDVCLPWGGQNYCGVACFSDHDCLSPLTGLATGRCEGYCCSPLQGDCHNDQDCCPTDGPGNAAIGCHPQYYTGGAYTTCCASSGQSCSQTADCCQPPLSGLPPDLIYQSQKCSPTNHCVSCQIANATTSNPSNCCSGAAYPDGGTNVCCMPLGTVGCNIASDCCPSAGASVMCGGSGAYDLDLMNNREGNTMAGYGICCRPKFSMCSQDSDCCDGYCKLNAPPSPNDAGTCYATPWCTF